MVSILNYEQKLKVASLINSKMSQAEVARQFGVSADTIRRVIKEFKEGIIHPSINVMKHITVNGDIFIKRDQLRIEPDNEDLAYVFAHDALVYERDAYSECYVDVKGGDQAFEGIRCRGLVLQENYYASDDFEDDEFMMADEYDAMIKERQAKFVMPPEAVAKRPEAIWNASSKFISITIGRQTWNADSEHPNFKEALQTLVDGDVERALDLINIERGVAKFVKGDIRIEDGALFYQDLELRTGLTERIVKMAQEGEDFQFLLPFLENLMENPSRSAVYRLFDFLQANDIEITEDGHFLAWKRVREDYTDCHSGKFDNSVGVTVKMPRNQVDEDDETTCSTGLHVCAKSYLNHFGGARIVQVKVHPRDVVSIPVDYGNAKMRTCQYKVAADVTETLDY
ncbi:protector from prophage-induced early lysis [Yersinia phage MHG19]|nr:protector from prophage-induced early lysis [Yersinia phage MHG19]